MKRIFFDERRRLRAGWWMLVFVALIAATSFIYTPLSRGLRAAGVDALWLEPVPLLFVLLVTFVSVRLRGERLADVGFRLDRRWSREAMLGTFVGAASILVIAALMLVGGVRFELDPARGASALVLGLYVMACAAVFEETLFRGFLFQRVVDGLGVWPAQLAFALLFAAGHWDNPNMEGAARYWAMLDIALGALLYGLAYLRTRSLALPIGMHFGWNFVQGSVLGFGVSGHEQIGWLQPVLADAPTWLTGGTFGPEASVVAVVVDLIVFGALWRWKGTVGAQPAARSGVGAVEPVNA